METTNDTGPLNTEALTLSNAAPKPRAERRDKGKKRPEPPRSADVLIAIALERLDTMDDQHGGTVLKDTARMRDLLGELKRAVGGGK